MSRSNGAQRVTETGLVAIVRASSGERLTEVAEALLAGGVDVIEIAFTVPAAHRVLEKVADRLGDHILLGAGTVLDPEPSTRVAMLAGARFVVSPVVNLDVIELCRRYDTLVMPGAMSPTEILTAWQAGAQFVKVFPADVGGPSFLKAIHGPLPQIRLLPTGGVNLETAADFLRAGAAALGVGGALVSQSAVESSDFDRITRVARQFVKIVHSVRGDPA